MRLSGLLCILIKCYITGSCELVQEDCGGGGLM